MEVSKGDNWTGQTIEIPSVTGETHCEVEFEYTPGQSALEVRAQIVIVTGAVADFRLLGKHAHLFEVEIEAGPSIRLSLVH